ncbi:orotidine-5'-phosphate decarboxylase [Biformimicrobium ophioploci]|uniref:Orotidine 5'-phosphate decarboxylase n=1 Tax=Biformimicrobium ophioploci TaxID=3036711 RepID=A0ABQ6M290_9GAMM|nr:orotidine-5'-phosphate decarboxylase [Microbulbifer sp. NKW57]GMG88455.1 orotidine-5'-phosphate decarboxylase [Microbulbifer sp. NKW57]
MSDIQSPIIVALDYPSAEEALQMAARLDPALCRVKVGKELFTSEGPDLVRALVEKGFDVFLDLKFHDIPNTVAGAVRAAARLGVWMVNVHATGGEKMMRAAAEALTEFGENRPLLTAVTVLTSTSPEELAPVGIDRGLREQVVALASLAKQCGLDGVVCSAEEASMLRDAIGENFSLVTPGIRPLGSDRGDQQRIVTPSQAMKNGSTYLVIGRPITKAESPVDALRNINDELQA